MNFVLLLLLLLLFLLCYHNVATSWTVRGSNPGGGARFSAPVQTGPGAHPASSTIGTGSFPGVKSGRGVTLTPHPLLVLWSWKGRAIPLLPLLVYGLYRASVPVQGFTFLNHKIKNMYGYTCSFWNMAWQPRVGQGALIIEASRSYSDTPQSVGLR